MRIQEFIYKLKNIFGKSTAGWFFTLISFPTSSQISQLWIITLTSTIITLSLIFLPYLSYAFYLRVNTSFVKINKKISPKRDAFVNHKTYFQIKTFHSLYCFGNRQRPTNKCFQSQTLPRQIINILCKHTTWKYNY